MSESRAFCSFCGRLSQRCACHEAGSDLQRFMERGGRTCAPSLRGAPYKRGVPPQVKRAERGRLRKRSKIWYAALAESNGECCANCGGTGKLALDHIVPIAKGGLSCFDNLQLLCAACNRIKGKLAIDCRFS